MENSKKTLLFISSRVPWPLEKGDKLRAYHQIRTLSEHFNVILFALYRKSIPKESLEQLSPYCKQITFCEISAISRLWSMLRFFVLGKPLQVGFFYSCKAKYNLLKLSADEKPDYVFCQMIRTAEYGKALKIPGLIDYQDALSESYKRRARHTKAPMRWFATMEAKRLKKYELEAFEYFSASCIISEQDKAVFPEKMQNTLAVIPNGIDIDFFQYPNKEKTIDVLFTGNMGYAPNVLAATYLAKEIMPLVWKKKPHAKLTLAGVNPLPKVKSLAGNNIEVTGWVENMKDYYAKAKIFIAPMQIGAGLQNKLLEAMAMGLPCISSELANNALQAKPDVEILIGHDAAAYANHILQLLDDQGLAARIANNGKYYVSENFSWEQSAKHITEIFYAMKQM